MNIVNHAQLAADELERIEQELGEQPTLQEVVRWGFRQSPPRIVADVVVQDEFTHDVVLPYRGELHLVFDTT